MSSRTSSALALILMLTACTTDTSTPGEPATVDGPQAGPLSAESSAAAKELEAKALSIFKVLPAQPVAGDNQLTPARVDLGRMLYFETRLSKNQDLSCNSCHALDAYGVDGKPTSPGHKGQLGGRNSPTVYNASLHVAQFWDGRAKDVEEQAGGPMLNPIEMAMPDGAAVTAMLQSIPGYRPLFAAAFPDEEQPVSYDNAADAIGAFERTLLTPAPFDAYLSGDPNALSPEQQEGLGIFMETGCGTCHNGALLGGQAYFKLGLVTPYETADLGRYEVTKDDADKQVFKVPSLRNITQTAPYFHDGSVDTLDQAVRLMGKHQLGKELDPKVVGQITVFLKTLTGPLPTDKIARPELPASGPTTIAPDPT